MSRFQQFLKKQVSIEVAISLVLSILILLWIFNSNALYFFVALYALLGASIIMLAYLVMVWRRLPKADRRNIGLNIVVWLFLAYAVVHANGLTFSALFGS